jgi:hypothetical protein
MKKAKYTICAALLLSFLSACSSANITSTPSQNSVPVAQMLLQENTENSDITEQEINEINKIVAENREQLTDNSLNFSVKTIDQGKDVDIEMLLFNPKAAKRAKFWGIKDADDLVHSGSSPFKRSLLNMKLGGLFASKAFKSQVLFWVERADMTRIKNVSLDDSFLLVMSGITSVPHLARFNNVFDQAALKVQLSLLAFQYGKEIPSLDEIKTWTADAQMLPPILY